ncbi:MAG: phospholipase [Pseudomonadota bacterium]
MEKIVVFVHGWNVTHTKTYGKLPRRLANEAPGYDLSIKTEEIFLGRYISFHDEVQLQDIARAFQTAVNDQLGHLLEEDRRFICITHSTGGPVVREWWRRYYQDQGEDGRLCPMSHLIMLAPANFGSALAVLGKGKVSRLRQWFAGIEPGQGVLDWLCLGSDQAWDLNKHWIESDGRHIGPEGVFPFVITGQTIDRRLYDNLNSYTGESGSDGVIRVAAANLQAKYVRLVQSPPQDGLDEDGFLPIRLDENKSSTSHEVPLAIVEGKSHSGDEKGIMLSVSPRKGVRKDAQTVRAIFDCINVESSDNYEQLVSDFSRLSAETQEKELVEIEHTFVRSERYFFHDRYSMVIFRVTDSEGNRVEDFDLYLTSGAESDRNHLPRGFFADRQQNPNSPNVVTYFFNHSKMTNCPPIVLGRETVRQAHEGATLLGLEVIARPGSGFARYHPGKIAASTVILEQFLVPNATTLVDIVLNRIVGEETFRLNQGTYTRDFSKTEPGAPLRD